MRIQSLNHSTYQHQYHIVWGTKYRIKFLKPYVLTELKKSLYATVKKYPALWSVGYFSSTVGLNEGQVKRYIAWQSKIDKPQKARLF